MLDDAEDRLRFLDLVNLHQLVSLHITDKLFKSHESDEQARDEIEPPSHTDISKPAIILNHFIHSTLSSTKTNRLIFIRNRNLNPEASILI